MTDEKAGNAVKDVKGADWYPLLKQTGENEWVESWENGIALRCKCGRAFFVDGIAGVSGIRARESLGDDISVAWFCPQCKSSFINPDMKCHRCGTQY